MKRVLIALALLACIGSSVMAQTYRPLTGTRLLLNSTFPTGGSLTLQANPGANYTLTLPSSSPSANAILANGSTAGTLEWKSPLDLFDFTNGLTETGTNTIELGGTLTKNTGIDIGTYNMVFTGSTGGSVAIDADFSVTAVGGSIELESPSQAITGYAGTSLTFGNLVSMPQRSQLYIDDDEVSLVIEDGGTPKARIALNYATPDGTITLEATQIDVNGHILPGADDTYDLGSNSLRWRDVFIGPSSLHIGTALGATEMLVGYNTGTNTAYFNIDNVNAVLTLNATSGVATSSALTVGDGDGTDILSINSDNAGDNLTISEDAISRNAALNIQGSDGTNTSSLNITNEIALATTLGDITIDAVGGGFTLDADQQLNLTATDGIGTGNLFMDPGASASYSMTDGSWEGKLLMSLAGQATEITSNAGISQNSFTLDAINVNAIISTGDAGGTTSVDLYGGASGYAAFSTATTERMRITDAGNVGIGTSTPNSLLEVNGSFQASGGDINLNVDSPSNTNINTGTSTGVVTIGNASTTVTLGSISGTVGASVGTADRILIASSDGTIQQASFDVVVSAGIGSSAWSLTGNDIVEGTHFLGTTTTERLEFRTDNVERMRIASDGMVSIGTTVTSYPLTVAGTADASAIGPFVITSVSGGTAMGVGNTMDATEDGGNAYSYFAGGDDSFLDGGFAIFKSNAPAAYRFAINADGEVHIGGLDNNGQQANFGSLFNVRGNASIGSLYWDDAAPADGLIVEGDVGIGTTVPTHKLDVAGTFRATDRITGDAGLTITGATTSLNENSNFSTDINTGTSTGAVNIGNTSSTVTVLGPTNINTTGNQATTIGNTSALASLLGGVKVSAVVNAAAGTGTNDAYIIGNELVVVQQFVADIVLPLGEDGRIVIIRNASGDSTIDVYENDNTTLVITNFADGANATLIYQGGAWYQIGN